MKEKRAETIVIVLALLLAAFAGGYFTGRNMVSGTGPAVYTQLPAATEETSAEQESDATPDSAQLTDKDSAAMPLTGQTASEQTDIEESNAEANEGKINLNTADVEALMTLPGIGEVLAGRIIEFREEYGPFASVEELLLVSGIGEKKLEGIMDLVYVGD